MPFGVQQNKLDIGDWGSEASLQAIVDSPNVLKLSHAEGRIHTTVEKKFSKPRPKGKS